MACINPRKQSCGRLCSRKDGQEEVGLLLEMIRTDKVVVREL
jgi:hypothetical protein